MPSTSRAFSANRVLSTLSPSDCRKLATHLTPKAVTLGEVLEEAGDKQRNVYFPVDCMVSLVAVTEDRATLEVGLVGREGMVGISIALGIQESPARSIVQGKGSLISIPSAEFARVVKLNAQLRAEALRYAYASLSMAMLIAACNNAHGLEARLARWMLMTHDCLSTTTFEITQEFIGQMLGVRRPSVNSVASELQRRGLISYRRGVIKLLDIEGLKAASCTCYPKIRRLTELPTDIA